MEEWEKGWELRDVRREGIPFLLSMSDSAEVLEEVRTVLKLRCLPEKPVDADKYIFARSEW